MSEYAKAGKDISTLRTARYSSYGGNTSMSDESSAMKIIEAERVKELYMEGFRLNDLKRWHKGFARKAKRPACCQLRTEQPQGREGRPSLRMANPSA